MAIEGTGIKTPSKESSKKATAFLGGFQKKADEKFIKTYEQKQEGGIQNSDFETDRYNKLKQKYGDQFSSDARPNYFSLGGGAFDERNNVQIASASTATDDGFNKFIQKDFGVSTDSRTYKSFPDHIKGDLKNQYRDSLKFQEGTQINQAPVKKPSFIEQTKNFAGSIFNTVTGTQPAAASEIPGGMPSGTQFTSSNLDAAKASTGDTSFASYRMAGQPSAVEQKQQSETVVTPTVKPQYEINRLQNRPSGGGTTETGDTSFSAYVRGGGEGQQRGIVSPTSTGAPRQTVASLPSDYKQTEAREFAKAAAFQQAKKNPNVKVGVDSKGQPTATAVQKGRGEAGASDRTAEGNKARVQQNARARAQAAAYNRKMSGKSISQTKADNKAAVRKSAAERHAAFKKTGKSTVGARRAAAKARVKAAAKKRHSAFKKRRKARRGRRGGRR